MSSVQYDVFISYSSEDRAWAEKFLQSLKESDPKLRIFFDQKELRLAQDWDPQLAAAVEQSKHLMVLWSKAANGSAWVQHELATFKVHQRQFPAGERRILAIMLDEEPSVLGATQALSELKSYYQPKALPQIDANSWQQVINRVVAAIKGATVSPIWRMFFTLTHDEFMEIQPEANPGSWGPP
jgi:hypothetical protein